MDRGPRAPSGIRVRVLPTWAGYCKTVHSTSQPECYGLNLNMVQTDRDMSVHVYTKSLIPSHHDKHVCTYYVHVHQLMHLYVHTSTYTFINFN